MQVTYHPTQPGVHACALQGFLLGEGPTGGGACFEARIRANSNESSGHPLVVPSNVDVGVCEVGERISRAVSIPFHSSFIHYSSKIHYCSFM